MVMDKDQWMYESIMSEEADMDYQNKEACGVNEPHVDCFDVCLTAERMFCDRLDPLLMNTDLWRSDTNTGSTGRTSFVLIGCERSDGRDTGNRKCGCPFKLRYKPVVGGEGWMVKLICVVHNHELANLLVGHPYAGQLTKAEKTVIADMTKSMVKPRNILLTLKEHNANNNTYKTNRYRLPLLDFVGVTPTGMTFSTGFAYVEGEHVNNVVWALQRFRGLFLKRDALLRVIVTKRDQALMNAVKVVFLDCTNLLCSFHINKNVNAKCKSLIGKKNVWDYVMDCWGCLIDCPSEQQFDECLKKFEMTCLP
ncbi:hypothetical protein HKD37_02G003737 [Glycine soja]